MSDITRYLFVHTSRIAESIITLSFDEFLNPVPTTTHILYGPDFSIQASTITDLYNKHGIDTTNFVVQSDAEFLVNNGVSEKYKDRYKFGGWIAQQLLKLAVIDLCPTEKLLIQDCDTFAIKEYEYFVNDQPNVFTLQNETHSNNYYLYLVKLIGIARQTSDCFITEFMPFTKTYWDKLKQRIHQKHNTNWYSCITETFNKDSKHKDQIWFSEYEFLGNWMLYITPDLQTKEQKRGRLNDFNIQDNCIAQINFIKLDDVHEHIENIKKKTNE